MSNLQRVWITGASSGFGAALAHEYAAHGHPLNLSARRAEALETVAAALPDPAAARIYPVDVTSSEALEASVAAMIADHACPDLAILNAGTYTPVAVDDFQVSAFESLFAVNFFAVVKCIELLVPVMRARGCGHIAIVGSVAGDIGLPYASAYSASKAACMRLAQSLRPELEEIGVNLSIINPGFIETPLTARNTFPMPFMVSAEQAAAITRRRLAAGHFEIRFPLAMSLVMRLLSALPEPLSLPIRRRMLHT